LEPRDLGSRQGRDAARRAIPGSAQDRRTHASLTVALSQRVRIVRVVVEAEDIAVNVLPPLVGHHWPRRVESPGQVGDARGEMLLCGVVAKIRQSPALVDGY